MGNYIDRRFFVLIVLVFLGMQSFSSTITTCEAFGTFGFDIHHRYSDAVQGILDLDGLPEKGTPEYYTVMSHRDHLLRGRRLADDHPTTPITFAGGNETYRINSLGFLHYANISVGTPPLWFLVALDTGSDLFWLPCDCTSCVRGLVTRSGKQIDLNIYSPNTSSTSSIVSCNSTFCGEQRRQCSLKYNACAYQVLYLSANTSSTGLLVEDVLHLETNDEQEKPVESSITFGCGIVQTGGFLDGAAPNGLFGLGMDNISVPSMLADKGQASNSFSMCFGPDGLGRIVFGDKGSSEQGETPFNLHELHPTYNITVTQISVGDNATDVDLTAVFDSGTSFTYLTEPIYSFITESFNSQVKEPRRKIDSKLPFEYCYDLSQDQNDIDLPILNFTMKGGDPYVVTDPIVIFSLKPNQYAYCLAMVKSGDIDIIGQNFMTGYRVVFDREKMVLGWKASNCSDDVESTTLPISPRNSTEAPSPASVVPEARSSNESGPPTSLPSPGRPVLGSHAPRLTMFTCNLLIVFVTLYSLILSS